MRKISDTGGRLVYRQGTRFSLLFTILIPVGIAARIWFEVDWLPVLVVTFMGVVMLFVGGMREQLVFDTLTRSITCTESFFWRMLRSETFPFSHVTGITVGPNYERENRRRGKIRESGQRLTIDWKSAWGGGGMTLGTFHDEELAMREARDLARRLGTSVSGGPKVNQPE